MRRAGTGSKALDVGHGCPQSWALYQTPALGYHFTMETVSTIDPI